MAYLFAEKYVGIRVKIEELKGERMKKPLPIGIDDFKKLRDNDFYYTDKTLFIKELLDKRSEVSLFTRPRRFGKTLELSMVKYFFESVHDPKLKNLLKIHHPGSSAVSHIIFYAPFYHRVP